MEPFLMCFFVFFRPFQPSQRSVWPWRQQFYENSLHAIHAFDRRRFHAIVPNDLPIHEYRQD